MKRTVELTDPEGCLWMEHRRPRDCHSGRHSLDGLQGQDQRLLRYLALEDLRAVRQSTEVSQPTL
jgi:hypothetical protein